MVFSGNKVERLEAEVIKLKQQNAEWQEKYTQKEVSLRYLSNSNEYRYITSYACNPFTIARDAQDSL